MHIIFIYYFLRLFITLIQIKLLYHIGENPALKDAKEKSVDRTQKEMARITSELGLPENFKLPF